MIRNENEYKEAVRRSTEERKRLAEHERALSAKGHTGEELQRLLDPLTSFHLQLEEEIESYERLKRGDFDELDNLHGMGRNLVGLRIALGYSQRELAEKLGVHETQVSRDERNAYFGIKVERVSEILDALGVNMRSTFEPIRPARRRTPSSVEPQ